MLKKKDRFEGEEKRTREERCVRTLELLESNRVFRTGFLELWMKRMKEEEAHFLSTFFCNFPKA